ncbi:hypothetical protein [Brevibacillus sp. MS2.2]|uniref:hypothetical protein n=1 Tax=Brevibacillus sp. MS2.2 TaxID=2738981 RepID=UPI0020C431C0|nr:hypothetical protein [Brevibacillus sp. MS2.2]
MKQLRPLITLLLVTLLSTLLVSVVAAAPISLLSGKTLKTGSSPTNFHGETNLVTDSDLSTGVTLQAGVNNTSITDSITYHFSSEQTIDSFKVIIDGHVDQRFSVTFNDVNGKYIAGYYITDLVGENGIYKLPTRLTGVGMVVFFNNHTAPQHVLEVDLYVNEDTPTDPEPEPEPEPTGDNALLVIKMISGLEKEFDLTASEVQDFIDWYNDRADGRGKETYMFDKDFNKGPFTSRKDYVAFSKIQSFEVMEYTK